MVKWTLFDYTNKISISIHESWWNNIALFVMRVIGLSLMTLRFFLFINSTTKQNAYDFNYLTFYGFVIAWIYFIVVILGYALEKTILKSSKIKDYLGQCIQMTFQTAFQIQFTLTILYWAILVPGSQQGTNLMTFDNLGFHLMPILLLILDFIFCSYQFPIRQLIIPVIVSAIYIVINQVKACTNSPVYEVFGCGVIWVPVVGLVSLTLAHFIGYLTNRFWRRRKMLQKNQNKQSESLLSGQ